MSNCQNCCPEADCDHHFTQKLLAEVERLRWARRDVAERQREACAASVWTCSQFGSASELGGISEAVRTTPLVTKGKLLTP